MNLRSTLLDVSMEKITDTKVPTSMEIKRSNVKYGIKVHVTYESKTCGLMRGANILLPADYSPEKQYPTLYFLHGIFGDENSIPNDPNNKIDIILGNLQSEGYIGDIITVFPNMFAATDTNAAPGFSKEGVWPYDNFINDLVNDLIPFIEANYSVKPGRKNRALMGFSMGGRETLFIGTQRSDLFTHICAIAPAPGVTPGKDYAMGHEGQLKEEDFVVALEKDYPLDLLLICCGTKDSVVGTFPLSYHNILTKNGVSHLWYEVPGADHDSNAIKSGFYNFLIRWGK